MCVGVRGRGRRGGMMTSAYVALSCDLEPTLVIWCPFRILGPRGLLVGMSLLALFTVCGSPKGKSSASVCNSHPQGNMVLTTVHMVEPEPKFLQGSRDQAELQSKALPEDESVS